MDRLRPYGFVFVVAFACFLKLVVAQVTDPAEVSALTTVKSSLIDGMKNLKNWKKGDPCTSNWTGVICFPAAKDDGYYHVREIHLMNMNLSGNLAPELGLFSHLLILNFMWNELAGSIPKEIGNIKSLILLLLNGNKLSGSLPDELGYLPKLNRFQIDENQISGVIPKSFSNLNSIRHIHFNNNSLSGEIPPELSNLSTLIHLLLDNNNLSGNLPPELSKLSDLRILQLDNNNFSGSEIPISYGNLPKLAKLSLRNCSLQGIIPDLSRIPTLYYLDLSSNLLSGSIPLEKLSNNMTNIILSNNRLNGSIPGSFSNLPSLQRLSLDNNFLSGSFASDIWKNKSFSTNSRLKIDLRNNALSNILGDIDPPVNVTLRLQGNPICNNASMRNIGQFCGPGSGANDEHNPLTNSNVTCPIGACPTDNNYEYVPASPTPCFCASPLRIGYRLKSPSFSYMTPFFDQFEFYVTQALHLEPYQLFIDSCSWEEGPRLRMDLKLFPMVGNIHTFNESEVLRIRDIFADWGFPRTDFFGPYELLNFTLLGPYSYLNFASEGKGTKKGVLIACIAAAAIVAAIISTITTIMIIRRHARRQRDLSRKRFSSKLYIKIDGVKSFSFKEMALATNDFDSSTQVGEGGYGTVYKGNLADKTVVAIKRAKEGSLQGQKEFLTEIELLSRLHHRNLVSLVGYCDEEGEQMLVYEFMPNGTLRDWLSAKCKQSLMFGARLRIALGAAKGILYLHTEAHPPIFHRDIKASNILLDSKLTAKVADFGLSRLAPVLNDEGMLPDHVSTIVKGTPGYVDPEYFLTRKLTDKSDVYSLGVVFLEILTGMRPISHGKNIVREVNLVHESGTVFSIVDSRMGSFPSECAERFVALALRCCSERQDERPSMHDVVRELETILGMMPEEEVDTPKSNYRFDGIMASSFSNTGKYQTGSSSNVFGSDLVSDATLSITPR
nr:probable LRR receptor-like serine/threonine-protein kinase At1g06840 isoform X1 [Ipomoea batatas]